MGWIDGENGRNSRWGLCLVCTAENYWPGDTGKVIPSMQRECCTVATRA